MASQKEIKIPSGSKVFDPIESEESFPQTIEQTMERLPNGTRRLAALLRTTLPIKFLWEVLTDYDRLSEFIPNLVSSEVLFRDANRIHLKQVGSQILMGLKFSAEVHLELIEQFNSSSINFHLLKGDFRRFEGSWKMTKLNNEEHTSLLYELTVQGCIGMPVVLIEQRLREDLKANLLAVEKAAMARFKK